MKKLLSVLSLALLCVACPHIDEGTTVGEFDICTTINNVDLSDGTHNAKTIVSMRVKGASVQKELDAQIVVSSRGRTCGGKFIGNSADFKAMSVEYIISVTVKDNNDRTIYGSATLPWEEMIIDVKFQGFKNSQYSETVSYFKILEGKRKFNSSKSSNNSHLPKEHQDFEIEKRYSSKAVSI